MTLAYPLKWPDGWKRTPAAKVKRGPYRVGHDQALGALLDSVRLLGADYPVVSTNIKVRNDGLPYAQQRCIEDAGVAVYFMLDGEQRVMACDQWWSIKDNIRAIGLAIDGLRAVQRSGASAILERAFAGFSALPGPGADDPPWHMVLDMGAARDLPTAERNYRRLVQRHHPDKGGDPAVFQRLKRARDRARKEVRPA